MADLLKMMRSIRRIFFYSILLLIKTIVNVYTYLTLPYYYYKNEPWIRLNRARRTRSKFEDPFDANSPWVTVEHKITHPIIKPTITEIIESLPEFHGHDRPALGYRELLYEENCYDSEGNVKRLDGRILKKVKLSDYQWLTYGQVDHITRDLSKGLAAQGVSFGHKVLILSETRVEWMLSTIALTKLGACVVTLFPNLGDEGLVYGINHTEIQVIIVSKEMLPKVESLINRLPTVRKIIYITDITTEWSSKSKPNGFPENVKIMSFQELKEIGAQEPEMLIKGQRPAPDDLFAIIYTSGTTGKPKPVMVTHKNVLEGTFIGYMVLLKELLPQVYNHIYIAFLPLAHVLELTCEMAFFMIGVRMGYSSPQTLNDTSPGLMRGQKSDLSLLRPSIITAVPLVLDRIVKEVETKIQSRSILILKLFNYLMEYKSYWTVRGYDCPIINAKICSLVSGRLGGNLKYMFVGGAPLNPQTQKIVKMALNIKLMQGYGTTETMAGALTMDLDDLTYGRVGSPLYGVKIKLEDWPEGGYRPSDKPNPRGEIVLGGDRISPGYYKLDECEDDIFTDSKGVRWFRTGDIGERCPDGCFKVIDRKKDLQKLANGKYVSLGGIEAALKSCPYVENIFVCGGPYSNQLVAIVCPNRKNLLKLCEEMDLEAESIELLCKNERIIDRVFTELCLAAESAGVLEKEMPARIKLVADEWTPDNDMLTAALKLKRRSVERKYQKMIESLVYGG